jgi:hypothetical protein
MQAQPMSATEAVAVLKHKIHTAQAHGLSHAQAAQMVARQLNLDPIKVAVILGAQERE